MRTVLAALGLSLLAGTTALAGERNLVELHRNAGRLSNKECLSCHQGIAKGVSLHKKIKTLHRLHLESKKDTPKECAACHASVDLRDGSAAASRKQVAPALCAACHGKAATATKSLFAE